MNQICTIRFSTMMNPNRLVNQVRYAWALYLFLIGLTVGPVNASVSLSTEAVTTSAVRSENRQMGNGSETSPKSQTLDRAIPLWLPQSGLVGWWPFNGNANDESGNGRHGSVSGAVSVQDRFGNSAQAYDFDGINDFIQVNTVNNTFFENDFAFSLWVNIDNYNSDYPGILVGENGFLLLNGGGPAYAPAGNQGKMIFQQGAPTDPSQRRVPSFASIQVSAGTFHHVVVTKNSLVTDFYIDGIKVATQTALSSIPVPIGNVLWFGRNTFASPGFYLDGKLDDIAAWSRSLTETEIQQLYSAQDPSQTVTDIDGNTYNTVTIGDQVWMKENLNTGRYRNGDQIPQVTENATWISLQSGAYTYLNNDAGAATAYGKLYNWYSATDPRGLCPTGYEMPSNSDWDKLVNYLGGQSVAGGKLKAQGTAFWLSPNSGATNESQFTGLPAGYREVQPGLDFYNSGAMAVWWTGTGIDLNNAYSRFVTYNETVIYNDQDDKNYGFSVRCIKSAVNTAPTGLRLSSFTVQEYQPSGTLIGILSATDSEGGIFTYNLVPGDGSTDNATFAIAGNELKTAAVFDAKVKSSYSIRVRATDNGGLYFEKSFLINIGFTPDLKFISSIATGAGGAPLKGLSEVRVIGNYAFAVSYSNTSFEVFNVANPAQPVHVAVLRNGDGGALLNGPIGMDIQGDFAYVNNHWGSVEVIDISDPTKPKHAATLMDGQGGAVLKQLYGGIRARGNYLYIVGRGAAVLEIIDISDPYKPFHAGLLNNGTGGASLANPYDLDFKDDFLFVPSYDANALEVLDISDPVAPKHFSTLFNGTGGAVITRPHNIKVLGTLAYITNNYDNNLEILDVSDPANPVHAGNYSTYPGYNILQTPHGIDAVGRYPVVTSVDGIWLLDANTPNAPKPVAVKQVTNPVSYNVFIKGKYVYVASGSDTGALTIFELIGLNIPNTAPSRLILSKNSIPEEMSAGSIIGNFISTDEEGGGVEYSLVSGTGSEDNSSFAISGSTLKAAVSFVYSSKSSYSIRVRVTDSGGLFREDAFTIYVLPGYLPAAGLVGWWPFNGNANDESGKGNVSIVTGSGIAWSADRNGYVTRSMELADGFTSYVSIPGFTLSGDFSCSYWINNNEARFSYPIGFGMIVYGGGYGIGCTGLSNDGLTGSSPEKSYFLYDGLNDGSIGSIISNSKYVPQTWDHVVFTRTGNQVSLYVNGVLETSKTLGAFTILDLTFGRRKEAFGFKGKLDDVGFWKRPLTASEVAQIYKSGPLSQQVFFNSIGGLTYLDSDRNLIANASSGLPVQFSSSNTNIAEIVLGNILKINGAGSVTITATQPGNENFLPASASQTITIAKAPLTATAENKSRTYGDANPSLTISYTGFRNNETASVIDAAPAISTAATATSNSGIYPITLSGGADNNYAISLINGTLTVSKAPLTATADNKSRTYGEVNPALTLSYTGFKNNESSSVIDTAPAVSTSAAATSNVGTYPITLTGGTDNNYALTLINGTLTVIKAALTAIADNKTRTYGDANPALTISYMGFKNNETSSVIDTAPTVSTSALTTSNVGMYPIGLSGGADNNYTCTLVDGVLSVTKAPLTATADNKSKTFGDANPPLSISYIGFKNNETATVLDIPPVATTTATTASNVGTYPITLVAGTDNNYSVTLFNGTLTVGKAAVTATADNKVRSYGDSNPVFTVSYSGFKNGENETALDAIPVAASTATPLSNTGAYLITLSGGADNNYALTLVNGTLTISKASLTATADNKSRTYGDPNLNFTISYSGFKNSETSAVIDTPPVASASATTTSSVGTYPIALSGGADNNYTFTLVDGILSVTKAPLTATADNKSRGYGDANPTLTISYTGFKNNETATVIDILPTSSSTAVATSPVGAYPVILSGGADNNYTLTLNNGTLTVNKAILTAKADDFTRPYDTDNPVFTVSYAGFKNNETVAVIDVPPGANTTATRTTIPGSYPITLTGGSDNNYTFSLQNGVLVITRIQQTVTFSLPPVMYQDQSPYTLTAVSTSNGPMVFSVTQGSATVSGNQLTITGPGALTVKAAQPGTAIYLPAEASASTNVGNSYVVSGLITKPVNVPLLSGVAKLFYEQGGLAKNGSVTNGSYSISLVRPGRYILQVVPTGNEESGIFPAYYNAALLNQDATVITVDGNLTVSMELPAKPGNDNDPKGNGEIKGKVISGNGGGRFIVGRIADGTGLANVPVYLLDAGTNAVLKTATTDKDGFFSFADLVTGNYKLALDVVGASLSNTATSVSISTENPVLEVSAQVAQVNGQPAVVFEVEVVTSVRKNELTLGTYPNPSEGDLRIRYSSGHTSSIRMTLVDIKGRALRTMSYEVSAVGEYTFPAADLNLSGGIYFLQLRQGDYTGMVKVVR